MRITLVYRRFIISASRLSDNLMDSGLEEEGDEMREMLIITVCFTRQYQPIKWLNPILPKVSISKMTCWSSLIQQLPSEITLVSWSQLRCPIWNRSDITDYLCSPDPDENSQWQRCLTEIWHLNTVHQTDPSCLEATGMISHLDNMIWGGINIGLVFQHDLRHSLLCETKWREK